MDKEDVINTHTQTHTHKGLWLSHKKDEILPPATTWMDLEGTTLSEINQIEKDKYRMISLTCGIYKGKEETKPTKPSQTCRYREQRNGYQRGRRGRRWNR